ncbi:hypothetical protein D3C78_841700 [compost metagenome]
MPPQGGIIIDRLRRPTRHAIIAIASAKPAKRQRHHDAHRRIKLNAITTAGAQCFPRHACPLYGSVLMQLHQEFSTAPVLAQSGKLRPLKVMQIHAVYMR